MKTDQGHDHALAWAALIHRKRTDREISQRKLAQLVRVQPSSVSMWESGRHAPGPDQVARLISVLDITADELHAVYAVEEAAS